MGLSDGLFLVAALAACIAVIVGMVGPVKARRSLRCACHEIQKNPWDVTVTPKNLTFSLKIVGLEDVRLSFWAGLFFRGVGPVSFREFSNVGRWDFLGIFLARKVRAHTVQHGGSKALKSFKKPTSPSQGLRCNLRPCWSFRWFPVCRFIFICLDLRGNHTAFPCCPGWRNAMELRLYVASDSDECCSEESFQNFCLKHTPEPNIVVIIAPARLRHSKAEIVLKHPIFQVQSIFSFQKRVICTQPWNFLKGRKKPIEVATVVAPMTLSTGPYQL